MTNCPHCGKDLCGNRIVCPHCGLAIDAPPESPPLQDDAADSGEDEAHRKTVLKYGAAKILLNLSPFVLLALNNYAFGRIFPQQGYRRFGTMEICLFPYIVLGYQILFAVFKHCYPRQIKLGTKPSSVNYFIIAVFVLSAICYVTNIGDITRYVYSAYAQEIRPTLSLLVFRYSFPFVTAADAAIYAAKEINRQNENPHPS